MAELRFEYEWERGDDVAAPELAATWARLQIWVGTECVTRVEDTATGSARRSIYCSLYPVAEWIAYNWWLLSANIRPAAFPRQAHLWAPHHRLRAAGDGFLWPDLMLSPHGHSTRVLWRPDAGSHNGSALRYIGSGEAFADSEITQHALSRLVDSVLARLDEMGVDDTDLATEWQAVTAADAAERQFCSAAASLGLDPYDVEPETAAVLEVVAERLDEHLLADFLGAVNPLKIQDDLAWVAKSANLIDGWHTEPSERLAYLRGEVNPPPRSVGTPPWDRGYQQAAEVRQSLDLSPTQRFDLDEFVHVRSKSSGDPALQGLGGFSDTGASSVIAGSKTRKHHDKRFTGTRGLWHFAYDSHPSRFLLTGGNSDQPRMERAFAAELLAPAAGIDQLVPEDGGVVAALLRAGSTVNRGQTSGSGHPQRGQADRRERRHEGSSPWPRSTGSPRVSPGRRAHGSVGVPSQRVNAEGEPRGRARGPRCRACAGSRLVRPDYEIGEEGGFLPDAIYLTVVFDGDRAVRAAIRP